ncbi:MAG: extracellular solute-binding protein [Caldilineaceae bacterium]|nr:extracellular solute-binding protein [Caldilineaceae bacterium]
MAPPTEGDLRQTQALNRRSFLKLSGVALTTSVLAACTAPVAPATTQEGAAPAAQPAALNFLGGTWFVPALGDYFQEYATTWGAENNVEFTLDIVTEGAPEKLAAAIEAQQGANLAQVDYSPSRFPDAVHDITDIAQTLIDQQGDFYVPVQYQCTIDGAWHGIPYGQHPRMINYREDWFAEVGYDTFPDTWDEVLVAGRLLKEAGHPYGWTLSEQSPADGVACCLALLWSFGGKEWNEDGTLALDSQETLDALNFAITLYNDTCDPASTSYQEASNNQAFLAGQISMAYNVNTIYLPARENAPDVAAAMNHVGPPEGPGGRYGYTGVAEMLLMSHTQGADLDAAKKFMLDFFDVNHYSEFLKLGEGYLIPANKAFDDKDVWPEDPKLAAVRTVGATGLTNGYALSSPTPVAAAVQTQVIIPKLFSVACTDGNAEAALDAALAEIADLQTQLG